MAIAGYEILGELGRGGMGVVYKARQLALERLVALKVCHDELAGWPESDELFRQEAQTLAQLQHPAIVPVYDLGSTADGRLFFTMQYIEGESLHAVLVRRPQVGERLLLFLGMFQAIAEALAVAHQRGILHRDLKPRNVMVSQGEQVHVVDWGLGKVLAAAAREESLPVGGGTAGYLSPEQAAGASHIDQRTDVFGLGAILCEILTGQPPYLGSAEQCLDQARKGDVTAAYHRLDGCGADRELVRLAKKCLASKPQDRPADAATVAKTVTQYLVGLQEKLQHERRRRRLAVALAVAVVLLVVTAGSAWVRRVETETAVGHALQNAKKLSAAADEVALRTPADAHLALLRWQQCEAAVKEAETALAVGAATAELRQEVATWSDRTKAGVQAAQHNEALLQALQQARLARRLEGNAAASARQYRRALLDYGIHALDRDPAAVADAIKAAPAAVQPALIAALDDWSLQASEPAEALQLRRVARRADADPWRQRLRDALDAGDRQALEQLSQEARQDHESPENLVLLAEALMRYGAWDAALELLRHAQTLHPGDVWIHWQLGFALTRGK
jgi:serine/threonine-protein kinase